MYFKSIGCLDLTRYSIGVSKFFEIDIKISALLIPLPLISAVVCKCSNTPLSDSFKENIKKITIYSVSCIEGDIGLYHMIKQYFPNLEVLDFDFKGLKT
mmetsp:Transcript_18795/g.16640  ORF Transcript_18795/g.16640 Transcript_18795/m.16640 type:complete len:99 (+) Transcript_18795:483-779(+)